MQMLWVLVLGLAYTVSARDCMTSIAMDNFDMNMFAGDWHKLSHWTPNKTVEEHLHKMKCVDVNYNAHDNTKFDVKVKHTEDGQQKETTGMYKRTDEHKGIFQKDFPDHPEYNHFVVKMVCTDYNNFAVMYACEQHESGHSSDYAVIMGRDRSKYGDLKNNQQMMKCLSDKMHISMDNMIDMNDGCH